MSTKPNYADTVKFSELWPGAELQGTLITPRATRAGIGSRLVLFRSEKGIFALSLARHIGTKTRLARLSSRESEAVAKAFQLCAATVKAMRDRAAKQEVEEIAARSLRNLKADAERLGFKLVPVAKNSRAKKSAKEI